MALCEHDGCRKLTGHTGSHNPYPSSAWAFLTSQDKNKLTKAGFATPRGGAKGAYQNHVVRTNKVILPYERLADVDLDLYKDGYVIRLFPDQVFDEGGILKTQFTDPEADVRIGHNAFVLYRTYAAFDNYPPLAAWRVRWLENEDGKVVDERSKDVIDKGEYVLRLAPLGPRPKRFEGPPQGLFATEYADEETNYLSKCVLAWLIVQTVGSPYTLREAEHLIEILNQAGLSEVRSYEDADVIRHGLTSCPLCLRFIRYDELHGTVSFDEEEGLGNAALQVEGATRSTIVNLFHLRPLLYHSLVHIPENLAWGHAVCNTRLGQRPCYSLSEIIAMGRKVGIVQEAGIDTFGWISDDDVMIRSKGGAVWIQLNGEGADGPPEGADEPFDAAVPEATSEGDE